MSFTIGSKAWVGNIYHKFESMCQEVDDFVTKDTVNYVGNHVGNQVQTVSENVKRFYSDIMQDFLPPPVNPVELEGQAMRGEQSNAITETELSFHNDGDAAIRSSHLCFKESMTMGAQGSHSSDNTSSVSLRSSLDTVGPTTSQESKTFSKSSEVIIEGEIIKEVKLATEESGSTELEGRAMRREQSEGITETESSFHNDGDAAICWSSHLSSDESMTMGNQGSYSSYNTNYVSQQSSLDDVGPTTAQIDETVSKSSEVIIKGEITEVKLVTEESYYTEYQKSSKSHLHSRASLEKEMVSTMGVTKFVSEGSRMLVEQSVTGESSSSDDNTLLKALMVSAGEDYKDPAISKFLPSIQLHDIDEGWECTDDGTVSSSISNDFCHVADVSLCERQLHGKTMRVENLLNVGSSSSEDVLQHHEISTDQDQASQVTSVTSLNDPEVGSFHKRSGELCFHADCTVCGSRVSSDLKSPTSSIDVMPDFFSSVLSSDFGGVSEDELKHCCQLNQLTALVSAVEIDPRMETIDLSDKEKLDCSCVPVDSNNKPLYAVSFRPRRFKSYKKLIQDALASRKRVVNEYKQLAIWYGDIDTESSRNSGDSPTIPATSLHSRQSQSCKSCESGWELL